MPLADVLIVPRSVGWGMEKEEEAELRLGIGMGARLLGLLPVECKY